jgi:hypothetical protein
MALKFTAHILTILDRLLNGSLTCWNSHAGANPQADPGGYARGDSSRFAGRIDLSYRITISV